ncbi:hypothetical protein KCTC52924_00899 [Arenibacter antarcticus]
MELVMPKIGPYNLYLQDLFNFFVCNRNSGFYDKMKLFFNSIADAMVIENDEI